MSPFVHRTWHDEIEGIDTPITAAALEEVEIRVTDYADEILSTNSVRHGTGAPGAELGINGDFYIDTSSNKIYGPKTAEGWGSATSLVGPQGEVGATGSAGKTILNGTGAPSGATGSDGDFYFDTASTKIYGPKASGVWPSGVELKGSAGRNVGLKYIYSSTITEADPETGKLRFNNATLSAATALYISETDNDGSATATWIQSWDDSTSALKGYVTITKDSEPSSFSLYKVEGSVTDKGTWDKVPLVYITGHGSLTDSDQVRVSFARTGDKGESGSSVEVKGPTAISVSPGFLTGGSIGTTASWLYENVNSGSIKKIHLFGQMTSNGVFSLGGLGYKLLAGGRLVFPCMASGLSYSGIPVSSAWIEVSSEALVSVGKPSGTTFSAEGYVDLSGIYFFVK